MNNEEIARKIVNDTDFSGVANVKEYAALLMSMLNTNYKPFPL